MRAYFLRRKGSTLFEAEDARQDPIEVVEVFERDRDLALLRVPRIRLHDHLRARRAGEPLLEAKLAPGTVPVLPLEPAAAVPGRAVMFLGYPAGLDLLLARVPPAVVQDLLPEDVTEIADDTVDMSRLLGELARRRLIRPHASWGRLAEVRPHVLTHDARTTTLPSVSCRAEAQRSCGSGERHELP